MRILVVQLENLRRYVPIRYLSRTASSLTQAGQVSPHHAQETTPGDANERPKLFYFFGSLINTEAPRQRQQALYYQPQITLRKSSNRGQLLEEIELLSSAILKGELSLEQLLESPEFLTFCEAMHHDIDHLSNSQLIEMLSNLLKMGVTKSHKIVRLFEHEIKFRLNSLSIKQLSKTLLNYDSKKGNLEQTDLVETIVGRLRVDLRSKEMNKDLLETLKLIASQRLPATLLPFIEEILLDHLASQTPREQIADEDETDIDRVADKAMKRIKQRPLDYGSLCRMFVLIAENKRRPLPLLRAASQCMHNLPESAGVGSEPSHIIETLNALSILNYSDHKVIDRLLTDLKREGDLIVKLSANSLRTLTRALTLIRWKDVEIIDLYLQNLEGLKDLLGVNHKVSIVTMLASLNCAGMVKSKSTELQNFIGNSTTCSPITWFEYVWSLTVLGIAQNHHLQSVLTQKFYETLMEDSDRKKSSSNILISKLRALLIASKLAPYKIECDLDESVLNESLSSDCLWPHLSKSTDTGYRNAFDTTLKGFMPNKFIRFNTRSKLGLPIDAELVTNPMLRPINDAQKGFKDFEDENLPSGLQRCAIIYVSNKEEIINRPTEIIGSKDMLVRMLNLEGYATAVINHSVFTQKMTSVDLTLAMQHQIKMALKMGQSAT